MEKKTKEKLNKIMWVLSPLHKEQVEKIKEISLKIKNMTSRVPKLYKITIAGGLSLALILGTAYEISNANKAFAIELNGKKVAVVEDQLKAQAVLSDVIKEKSKELGQKVEIGDKVTYNKTKAKNIDLDGAFALKRKLNDSLKFITTGTVIKTNGEEKVVLLNKKEAEKVIGELAKSYISSYKDAKIEKIEYVDKVEFINKKVNIKDVANEKDVIPFLKQGKQKAVTYTVTNGDNVWSIARKNDTYISRIQEANPGLNVEKLKLGQVINLNKVEPQIKLKIYAKGSATEAIAYDVKIERDENLYSDQEKVKQLGETGSKEVTYSLVLSNGVVESKNVIAENVTKPAVAKVVAKGSKYMVASRGNGGSGQLGWPISGSINSGFGYRSRGDWHPGIDIGGSVGTPVGAAADGVVTFAGWDSGYGKIIRIDHGNGLTTNYAHLRDFNTSVGASVSRGQIIGFVGMTGRTTGPHLHFEVRIGGSPQNPLGFLR